MDSIGAVAAGHGLVVIEPRHGALGISAGAMYRLRRVRGSCSADQAQPAPHFLGVGVNGYVG